MTNYETRGCYGPYIQRLDRDCLHKENLMEKLPSIGDTLTHIPTILTVGNVRCKIKPCECKVTYVNKEKLWYEVIFTEGPIIGIKECYHLPKISEFLFSHKQELLYAGDKIAYTPRRTGKDRKNGQYTRIGE